MPRNLSRLKFRAPKPPPPLNLARLPPGDRLPQALKSHVLAVSKPAANLAVRTVMVQKWKQQPGKTRKQQFRPHTLKDMVDPAGKAKHGQIIYIFRNTRTNQVIYSLAELLDVRLSARRSPAMYTKPFRNTTSTNFPSSASTRSRPLSVLTNGRPTALSLSLPPPKV